MAGPIFRPKDDPSLAQIREACLAIQVGWSAAEEYRRRADPHLDGVVTLAEAAEALRWSVPMVAAPFE